MPRPTSTLRLWASVALDHRPSTALVAHAEGFWFRVDGDAAGGDSVAKRATEERRAACSGRVAERAVAVRAADAAKSNTKSNQIHARGGDGASTKLHFRRPTPRGQQYCRKLVHKCSKVAKRKAARAHASRHFSFNARALFCVVGIA